MVKIRSITNNARIVLLSLVAMTFSFATVIGNSQSAFAAGECGAGYTRVGSHAIRDWENNGGDSYVGTLEVYWSGSAGRNCAIARCEGSNCGKLQYREVYIRRHGDLSWNGYDKDWYKYYAGPAKSYVSGGRCIDILARFSSHSTYSLGDKGTVSVDNKYCG